MVLYNVTVNVDSDIIQEWVEWMKAIHIPEVIGTNLFIGYKFFKLHTKQSDETGETYCIQYYLENMERYDAYQNDFAPALQQKTLQKYGSKLLAFRTLMEEI